MSDVKTIRLRYAGRCEQCGTELAVGERAHYLTASKKVRCMECGPGGDLEIVAGASAAAEADQQHDRERVAARRAAAFAAGAEGERIVASVLAPLTIHGCMVLHDRACGRGANLDHLVVAPTGVWLVNAKHWSGSVRIDNGVLRHNGRDRRAQLERASAEVALVVDRLAAVQADLPVRAVWAFTNAKPDTTVEVAGVIATEVENLGAVVTSGEIVADVRTIDRVTSALAAAFPPAGERGAGPYVDVSALPEDLRSDRGYYTCRPWSRGGRSRLYVRRGADQLGYIDLVGRTIQVESDHERARPNLEFIQMWFASPKPVKDRRSLAEKTTLKLAGLTDRAVVSVRNRDRGTDELEVFIIDIDGRRKLGRVDLLDGIVDAEDPAFEAVVAHAAVVARSADPTRAT